jgi:hypothetical protein
VSALRFLGTAVALHAAAIVLVPVLINPVGSPAQSHGLLSIEVWSIDDTIIHGDSPPAERLLREARFSLSGQVFGWDFVYTPAHPARNVSRDYRIEPVAQFAFGDPRLRIRDVRNEFNLLYGQVEYELSAPDQRRYAAARSLEAVRSAGVGRVPIIEGLAGKQRSIELALIDAIREHLRRRSANRPRRVSGTIRLERPPRVTRVSGNYESHVRALIVFERIEPYRVF